MNEWLTTQLARGFPDLAGAALSGSIPVKEELINEMIARFLAESGDPQARASTFDPRQLLRFVRAATIHAEPGVVTLRFEIRI